VNLGRAGGRNKLAASAKGSLLVFFDDDLRPLTNCISIHREHHAIFSNSILVGATPEDPALVTSDMHHYKAYLSAKWEKGLLKKQSCTTGDTLFLSAANMSIPASTFRELKGFNESLSDAEDLELGHRARQSGVRISYNSNAIAWHDDLITGRLYVLRQRQYQEAQEIIMALQDRQSPTWNRLSIAKRMMYNLFSRKLFVKMIDHSSLFLLIPRNLRYKMYSLIIWGLATTYRHREV
jgi:GT2 family glycosyltransferase